MRGKLSIIVGFTAALGAMSAHAQTDAQKSAAAVLAATDQFAREYGSGVPRNPNAGSHREPGG